MTECPVHGIDFSGNVRMWAPGCKRSNVWTATAKVDSCRPELREIKCVPELPGEEHSFERLVKLLADGELVAFAERINPKEKEKPLRKTGAVWAVHSNGGAL